MVTLPFLLAGESVFPGGRVTASSMSQAIRASTTPALMVSASITAVSDSTRTVKAVSSAASWVINTLSSDVSEHGLHRSEDISGVITRKCVFSDIGMDSGHSGAGSELAIRKNGWKGRKCNHSQWRGLFWLWFCSLPLQPVAVLPMPSAWWDSDCPLLMAWPSVPSHSWERWDESFQDFQRKSIKQLDATAVTESKLVTIWTNHIPLQGAPLSIRASVDSVLLERAAGSLIS